MEKKEFMERMSWLREQKHVSARDMSLSLGFSAGYINNIENGINFPSMENFFYICQYLNISEKEFFDIKNQYPQKLHAVIEDLKKLNEAQLDSLSAFLKTMLK